jgi:dipeptidyl aminopeptidase/acylaminoacyl peptidase
MSAWPRVRDILIGLAALAVAAVSARGAASARLGIVIAHDQTISYATGEMTVLPEPGIGALSVLDLDASGPVLREVAAVPISVIGPPTSVALHPTKPLAIVTRAMRPEKIEGRMQHVPDRRVSLVRLEGDDRGVIATLEVGLQPSSVSISPDGHYALVTNRSEGTLSVIEITGTSLKERERVRIAQPGDSLSHVEISPDGTLALATLNQANATLLLRLDRQGHPEVVDRIEAGAGPYAARFMPDGRGAVVANIGSHDVVHLAIEDARLRVLQVNAVGRIPEGIDISPDGSWMAVSCMEGANLTDKSHPLYGRPGRVHLFRFAGGHYEPAGILEVGGGPQAAVFSPDGQRLLVTNTGKRQLLLYRRQADESWSLELTSKVPGEPIAARRRG